MKFREKYQAKEYIRSADSRTTLVLKDSKEKREYRGLNPGGLFLTVYQVDGGLLQGQESKCDYAVYTSSDNLYFIELKGGDYSHALDQLQNTIRLLIYSKRFLIHTMRLVGATPGFIRGPFVRYNLVSGIFAAILAILMLTGALYYLQNELSGFVSLLDMRTLLCVYAAVFGLGVVLSVIATIFAVNKYLRMEGDRLYYI